MTDRNYVLIDATLESQTPGIAQVTIFQSWLRCFDNIPEALQFIAEINLPYSIEVWVARDNLREDVLPTEPTGQTRTLIQTMSDSDKIDHVTIFCPGMNTDLEDVFRTTLPNPRLVKPVISVVNLRCHMCLERINDLERQINRYLTTQEAHLVPNLRQQRDELMKYLKKLKEELDQVVDTLVEEHSNKLAEESS